MRRSRKFRQCICVFVVGRGGGVLKTFKSSTYFTDGRTDLPREAIGPVSRGSVQVFLRKHIATCNFPGEVGGGGGQTFTHSGND